MGGLKFSFADQVKKLFAGAAVATDRNFISIVVQADV